MTADALVAAPTRGRLVGSVAPVEQLAPAVRERMYALLSAYFDGVTRRGFEADLREKAWALLLNDADTGELGGFSTLMTLRARLDGERHVAYFSGDTIVARPYRVERALSRLWARHVFGEAATVADARTWWFLICSGYRTYRFLPTFFREYYPRLDGPTPPGARRLLDELGARKFGGRYDAAAGVVRLERATPLRPGVAPIGERRLRNPHAAYFAARNPGHAKGDELACLAAVAPDNLTAAGRRMLGEWPADAPGGDAGAWTGGV